jgi:hypothetical protein
MPPQPPPQLSPELVLILPPEVAAIARMTLPEPRAPVAPRRRERRPAQLAGIYAVALALTLTPFALAMKAVPRAKPLPVNQHLRADRNHAH